MKKFKFKLISLVTLVLFFLGCASSGMRVTSEMEAKYGRAISEGISPANTKSDGLAYLLCVIPGLGIWYASDSLADGVGYFFSTVLVIPWIPLSFIDAGRICRYQNVKDTIGVYDAMLQHKGISDSKKEQNEMFYARLKDIKRAFEEGLISENEYNTMRANILNP